MRAYQRVLDLGKTIGFVPQPHFRAVGGREFCDASFSLQHLLEIHLCRVVDDAFPSDGWVDGFQFDEVELIGRDVVSIFGLVVWVKGQESWWLDPGAISIRYVPGTDVIAQYTLTFGDAVVGLAKRPYVRNTAIASRPGEWLFEFSGPNISGLNA
jgi:hypothetical protein